MFSGLIMYFWAAVIFAVIVAVLRRDTLGTSGPALVLRRFEVSDTDEPAVLIEGRPSGFTAWILTMVGLDTLTTFTVTEDEVRIKSASLSGEIHHVVPTATISSTHSGYTQPIGLLILAGIVLLASLLMALKAAEGAKAVILLSGLVAAIACALLYVFNRKIAIVVETFGGMKIGVAMKPSAIEGVHVNLQKSLKAVARVNRIIVAHAKAKV